MDEFSFLTLANKFLGTIAKEPPLNKVCFQYYFCHRIIIAVLFWLLYIEKQLSSVRQELKFPIYEQFCIRRPWTKSGALVLGSVYQVTCRCSHRKHVSNQRNENTALL